MIESILTISITGLLAGFIFAMPIAGPVSILIASSALKGRLNYCNRVSLGATFADFTFVFIAVFGLTKLYNLYSPAIPYLFASGSIFLLFLGYKILRTKIDIEHLEDDSLLAGIIKKRERGAFYTGLMINFFNPTLVIGSLTSSFLVISFVASLGFNTGGLAASMGQNVEVIKIIEGYQLEQAQSISVDDLNKIPIPRRKVSKAEPAIYPKYFHLIVSICYAFFLAVGSLLWFLLFAFMIVRFRKQFSIRIITVIIRTLGMVLGLIGLYFGYLAVGRFI